MAGFSKSKRLLPISPAICFFFFFFFFLSCSSLFVLSHSTINASNIIVETRVALISFKSRLSDPNNTLASWGDNNNNNNNNYCKWRGVTCGRRHPQNVIALELNSLGLVGTISPSLSNITFLRSLDLADNHLDGNIPEELGRLSRLRHLNLSLNSLQGTIPSTLSQCSDLRKISLRDNTLGGAIPSNLTRCLSLQILSLTNNMLGGEIPDGIASLPALKHLLLGGNGLVGRIPPSLGTSPSLTVIELWNSSLSGHIPHSLINSSTLQWLHLRGNSLTGEVPSLLGNNTSLLHLDLYSNRLTGSIPPFSMNPHRLSPLSHLYLGENHLTGEIPPSLSNLSSIEILYLNQNNLEGSIPESLGDIPNLSELSLYLNRLSNMIPSSLYNISTITMLDFSSNRLSGTLPHNIGLTLPNLEFIILYMNQFRGPIPVSLCNASGLQHIDLSDNFFGGVVPSNLGSLQYLNYLDLGNNSKLQAGDWSFVSSLTNCSLLVELYLAENRLEGALPSSVGNLSAQLLRINIGNNQISGTIPVEIGNLSGLTVLAMHQNLFTGQIPVTIGKLQNLVDLDFSRNRLTGTIPSSIGNLSQLSGLHLEGNELSGEIPATIGGCKTLRVVDLSQNALQGSIPRELVSLSSLSLYLDVSYNYLVGSIPKEVGSLINLGILDVSENKLSGSIPSTIGSCLVLEQLFLQGNSFQGSIPQSFRSLQILNLSFNDFEGEVPIGGVFSNASAFSVLGNKKLCGGDPIFQLVPCSVYHTPERNRKTHRIVIPVISVAAILLLFLFGVLFYSRRKTRGQSPTSSIMDETFKKISYGEINKATDGFSSANLVGAGSFGSVYKGKMNSEERIVAVKVLNLNRKGASRSFIAECEALRSIRHRNLVKIITACSSLDHRGNEFKALVFEYMANGNLEQWLHSKADVENPESQKLTLIQRLNIAIDIVSALDYLHHSCDPPVVHRDLKPSNVLLDNDMIAHVGDFGLARLLREETSAAIASKSSTSSLAGIKGTVGYVAPEYGMGSETSTKGDVYSFGVLLLEMMTAKRPTDDVFKDGLTLQKFVEMAYSGDDLMAIIDQRLLSENRDEDTNILDGGAKNYGDCIRSLIRIGTSCANDVPKGRMEIGDVADELRRIKEHFLTG